MRTPTTDIAHPDTSLRHWIDAYRNTAAWNDEIFRQFTFLADSRSLLKKHRDYVEEHGYGFGYRAFHHLWYLLLHDLSGYSTTLTALEIGVYKGQVLSLWVMVATALSLSIKAIGISPLSGTEIEALDRGAREELAREKSVYPDLDYLKAIKDLFREFSLPLDNLRLIRGLSTNRQILSSMQNASLDLLYIDGDHRYNTVLSDIRHYSPLVRAGGYLIMDDAGFFLPGEGFWKGIKSVSRACAELPALGFANVLNVAHARVFQRKDRDD